MKSVKSTVERTDEKAVLKILSEQAPVGVCIMQDEKCCYVNSYFLIATGYTADELVGKDSLEIVVPEDRDMVRENALKMLKGELLSPYQFKVICKDGSIIWVMATVRSIQYHGRRAVLGNYMEITERKQAEEALRQSEEKHRALFDSSVIGMFVMDAETMKIVMCNQAAAKMFGFSSAEEAIGANPLDFLSPEFRDKAREITVKELFEQDLRRTHEFRAVNEDGREGWISVTGARIMHEGRLAGLVSITDINLRKQAVEALRQSEERYRTILEEMEDAYFEVDLGGHFTFVNNSVCRDLGYSREELIGMSYKDYTVEEDIESVFRVFNEVYRTAVPNKGFPWKTIRKDGSHGFAETSVSLLRNDKGEIIGFRGVGRDITERKQAEEKLRQSEENYKTLFNSSVIGMYVLDVETMKVVMGNRAAVEMAGFSSARQGMGINPLDFVIPEDREQVLEIAGKEFEQDLRRTHELRVIAKDGGTGWISISSARIMHKGRLAALISFTDITEQKRQNERLMMADRLASIGELAAGTAHELNNPLTSVIGFSQLLMEKDIPNDIREDLGVICSEAQRAADVTKQLLKFARKHAPVKQLNQINNIIEDTLRLRAYEQKVHNIRVERELAPAPPEIMVDYFQLQQVFLNIIVNAEYFMTEAHNGGTLTITTRKRNNTVVISFADDGPGIPQENLNRLFDPFFTTKKVGMGTGLGLSICHGIVTEHGGQIYVRSQPGKGATFFAELPINSV